MPTSGLTKYLITLVDTIWASIDGVPAADRRNAGAVGGEAVDRVGPIGHLEHQCAGADPAGAAELYGAIR